MPPETQDGAAVLSYTKTIHHDTYPYISPEKLDFSGRSVFITGASKGIGRQTALSYAAAGCSNIAIGARSDLSGVEQEIKQVASKMGRKIPKVVSMKLDVTVDDSVKAAAEVVTKEFDGVLDVLVANAGYLDEWVPLADSDPSEWWKSWEINVKGTYLTTKYFIPLLLKGKTKTCILSSSYGATMINVGGSAYQVSKFALCRLSQFICNDYSEQGLVCFAVHPGSLKTELALNMPEYMHSYLVDEPELTGDAIAWLGKETRPWMSGRFISVHWDMEELEAKKDEIVKGGLLTFRMMT
ncbi:hypothetical protein F5X96DRAFT_108242 [Biscogniauxia mediterranea]|nr:hypothetical protein F5X96DRAFT_108242 [Biscogniauxia mediterranea]